MFSVNYCCPLFYILLAPPFILSIQASMAPYMKCNGPCSVQQPHGSHYYVMMLVLWKCVQPKSQRGRVGLKPNPELYMWEVTAYLSLREWTPLAWHTAKAILYMAKGLPCATHSKPPTTYNSRQRGPLPWVVSQTHNKEKHSDNNFSENCF